jgi:putative ABC transport system substrate-binding protein
MPHWKPVASLVAILALFASWPSHGLAAERVYRIGVLNPGGPYTAAVDGLRERLQELGYVEGKNIAFDAPEAQGDWKVLERAAERFVRERVDLVYSVTTGATKIAHRAVKEIPIVFNVVGDPLGFGFVKSLASPGGNLTGLSNMSLELSGRRLEVLKQLVPRTRRLLAVYNPEYEFAVRSLAVAKEAAPKLGVEIVEVHTKSIEEVERFVKGLKPGQYDGLFVPLDANLVSRPRRFFELAREKRLPTIVHEEALVHAGALAGYGTNFHQMGRQAASYVAKILKGAQPQDLPVERPSKIDLVINLRTARAIGLTIPKEILLQADKVIR